MINWFKLDANFDKDDRITLLENERNGCVALYHYIKLNCIAARCNQQGGIYITEGVPHTAKTLAKLWHCEVKRASNTLDLLTQTGLLEVVDGVFFIADWGVIQSTDKLEQIRENARIRKQKSRERLAMQADEASRDRSQNVTECHTAEEEKEEEKGKETEGDGGDGDNIVGAVTAHYNATAAFPKIKILSSSQKEAVVNAVKEFGLEQIKQCIDIAEKSEFLNGKNSKGWVASFDWLIKPESIAKILNGNYDTVFGENKGLCESSYDIDEFVASALKRGFED